jgi:hypothetical protein
MESGKNKRCGTKGKDENSEKEGIPDSPHRVHLQKEKCRGYEESQKGTDQYFKRSMPLNLFYRMMHLSKMFRDILAYLVEQSSL